LTLSGVAGVETGSINAPPPDDGTFSVPNRFFDSIRASYYVTDNFQLSIGHRYTFGTHALTLGAERGVALGGGRMASLFAEALFAEGGNNAALAGLRIYFGQHDKTLIERHRQDDPVLSELRQGCGVGYHIAGFGPDVGQCVANGTYVTPTQWTRTHGCYVGGVWRFPCTGP
jgi:hypothetical protein